MIQIPLSRSGPPAEFAAALESHRADLAAHRVGKPGEPAPVAHELLDGLIVRKPQAGPVADRGPDEFVIVPYEIYDDTPTLAERKAALAGEVSAAAQAAINAVLSPAKAHLVAMDASDASVKPEETRTPAERAVLDLYTEYQSRSFDINRAALRATVAIEDLTESTIDGWQVPAL